MSPYFEEQVGFRRFDLVFIIIPPLSGHILSRQKFSILAVEEIDANYSISMGRNNRGIFKSQFHQLSKKLNFFRLSVLQEKCWLF